VSWTGNPTSTHRGAKTSSDRVVFGQAALSHHGSVDGDSSSRCIRRDLPHGLAGVRAAIGEDHDPGQPGPHQPASDRAQRVPQASPSPPEPRMASRLSSRRSLAAESKVKLLACFSPKGTRGPSDARALPGKVWPASAARRGSSPWPSRGICRSRSLVPVALAHAPEVSTRRKVCASRSRRISVRILGSRSMR